MPSGCRRWLTVRRDTLASMSSLEVRWRDGPRRPRRSSSSCATACASASARSTRSPRWSSASRWRARLRRHRPGRRALRGRGPGRRASSSRGGLDTGLFDDVEPNPGTSTVVRGAVALPIRARRHGRRPGRWRLVDGRGQGPRPARRERGRGLALGYDREDLAARRARRSPSRRPPAPAPRRTRTASSPTRRPVARTTSATRRCCPWRRSSTRR